jgi:hypothetical protein
MNHIFSFNCVLKYILGMRVEFSLPLRDSHSAKIIGLSIAPIHERDFSVTSSFSGKSKYIEPSKTGRPEEGIIEDA